MSQQISLFIDVSNRQLLRSNTSTVGAFPPDVFQGDTVGLYLEFLDTSGSTPQDIDYSAATVTVAIGTIGAQPQAGNFTLTDPAATQTTGNIAYNASAATVQTAIQSALTSHWSTATVTGNAGGPYTITNGANGAETALLGSSVTLTPASSVSIGTIQTGTGSLPQIHYVQVLQNPIALQDTFTPYPSPTAIVTRLQTGSGTQSEIQQITLGNNPYSGAFNVNFGSHTSNPIQWNASPATVQTALQAMTSIGTGNCSVGGSAGAWVVTFTGSKALASQTLMTTLATGLVGPLALTGTLSLNTAGIEEAIGESASISQTFAIRVTPSGESPFTVLQDSITIFNDLIVGAPAVPTPTVTYYTEVESDARFLPIAGDAASAASTLGVNIESFGFGDVTGVLGASGILIMDDAVANGLDLSTNTGNFGGNAAGIIGANSGAMVALGNTTNFPLGICVLDGFGNLNAGSFTGDGTGLDLSSNTTYNFFNLTNQPDLTGYSFISYAVASGTNTYTASITPAIALFTGYITTITFTNANTGASTLNLNSGGAVAIQLNGSALTSAQITAGSTRQLVYDGTQFQIIT